MHFSAILAFGQLCWLYFLSWRLLGISSYNIKGQGSLMDGKSFKSFSFEFSTKGKFIWYFSCDSKQ